MLIASTSLPTLLLMVQKEPPQAVWYDITLSSCAMVSEVKRRGMHENKISISKATSRSSLLVAHQSDESHKLQQSFVLVDSFSCNLLLL